MTLPQADLGSAPNIGTHVNNDLTVTLLIGEPFDFQSVDLFALKLAIDRIALRDLVDESTASLTLLVIERFAVRAVQELAFGFVDLFTRLADDFRCSAVAMHY